VSGLLTRYARFPVSQAMDNATEEIVATASRRSESGGVAWNVHAYWHSGIKRRLQ
jgi:hypothetical protein